MHCHSLSLFFWPVVPNTAGTDSFPRAQCSKPGHTSGMHSLWNTVLGPALLMHPSRDMVTSPQVPGESSLVSSHASLVLPHAYIGEIKAFISIVGKTPVLSVRLVLSFPLEREALLRESTVMPWRMQDTLPRHKKAGDSVALGTWLHRAFSGLSHLRWHRANKFFTKIPL